MLGAAKACQLVSEVRRWVIQSDFFLTVMPFLVLMLYALLALPTVIGVIWIRPDANRVGQPGWLWALATIPLNWVAVLAYLVVRALRTARS
jgi:hypothetical protein